MSIPKTQKVALVRKISESADGIEYADMECPAISGPNEVIVKNSFAGINFIDAYFRKGVYGTDFPHVFGREASGVVAAVGDKVTDYKVGDKVAYLHEKTFAQYTKISESTITVKKLPADSTDQELKNWAGILLQGLTAITLPIEAYEVKKGDFILVWAAAGGVGQILTKFTASRGARVIAIASSDEKLQIAKDLGAEFLIKSCDDIPAKVMQVTNGEGVSATFDSVGKDSFEASFASLGRKGTFVSYGNASGVVPPLNLNRLQAKNLRIIRSSLFATIQTKQEWEKYTSILQDALKDGTVKTNIYKTYPLSEYAQATSELEARKTTGKLVLEIL